MSAENPELLPDVAQNIKVGMAQDELFKFFPKVTARCYRESDGQMWITFDYKANEELDEVITFHLKDKLLLTWQLNDREENVTEYLSEFAPFGWPQMYPNLFRALKNVLVKLPSEAFFIVTNRKHPVVFTEYHTSGVARFANTSGIVSFPDDPPAFGEGLCIVKFSSELNASDDISAIEGVIFHELAHVVLGHLSAGSYTLDMEKDANHLVKDWGFGKEYAKAKEKFGSHAEGTSP